MSPRRSPSFECFAQLPGSINPTQRESEKLKLDDYTGYRVMYHVEKFTAGWRNLVLFYLAMFIAGYAKTVDVCLFWGAVAALLLVYWEPYLSPEFPWNSALTPADAKEEQHILSAVGKWGTMPNRMAARSFASASSSAARSRSEERQALLHYLHCLGLSLPHRQQLVHRVIQSFIVVPCVAMCVGVWRQTLPASGVRVFRPDDEKAVYYSAILLTLMLIYTLLTVGVNIVFWWLVKHKLKTAAAENWQPQHMMHFLCKVLGQCLNTVVQTLVAGAFVEYMPGTIFWLGAVVTGMSYTATNLIYDLGPPPVQEEEVDFHWLENNNCFGCTSPPTQPRQCNGGLGHASSTLSSGSVITAPVDSASSNYGSNIVSNNITTSRDDAALTLDCGEGAKFTANKLAGGKSSQSADCEARSEVESLGRSSRNGNDESPPFLMYKWPSGVRGWSIIALLIGQAGPCIAILTMLVVGQKQNKPELYIYISGTGGSKCVEKCLWRYKQLLYALACLGIITCYYAITIGFLGRGPVTFVYRYLHRWRCMLGARQKMQETSSSMHGADAC